MERSSFLLGTGGGETTDCVDIDLGMEGLCRDVRLGSVVATALIRFEVNRQFVFANEIHFHALSAFLSRSRMARDSAASTWTSATLLKYACAISGLGGMSSHPGGVLIPST